MSVALRPPRGRWGALAGLWGRLGEIGFALGVGILLGMQYVSPNKRVIPVMVAVVLFGLAWRVDMATGLGILILALPLPRSTVFGNTNLAFVLLLLVIWLLRVTMGQTPPPRRTPADAPLLALFICYTVSLYNIEGTPADIRNHFESYGLMVACWVMFYLIANNMRSERDFRRLLNFQAVTVALVCGLAVYELSHPGTTLIAGWLSFISSGSELLQLHEVRVGSVFFDFELLCEFCAMSSLLALFLLSRATSGARRVLYGGLLVLTVFVLFATVTRGGIIALAVGLLYLLWLLRRRLNVVTVTILVGLTAALATGMNWYVSTFTGAGSLFERLGKTEFVGLVPDSRVGAWRGAWQRIFEHPLLGHGPAYTTFSGRHIWTWPHCLYLYVANNVGFIGLGVFLWLMFTLLWISRPTTDDLAHGDYVQSYRIIAHVQMVVFLVDEIKIEYLRSQIYQFEVWVTFALVIAAYQTIQSIGPARSALPAEASPGAA